MTEPIDKAAKVLAACMDYPWEHMPEQGRALMRQHAKAVVEAALSASPAPAEPVIDAFKPMTASEVADAFLHRSAEPVQQDTRKAAADALLQAAHAFWKSEREAGMLGAVKWLTGDDGSLVVFTRGEYRHALMQVVGGDEDAEHRFATSHPVQPEEAVARDAEEPSEKQRKLLELADRIDHEKLWAWAGMDHHKMTPEQRDRMNAGVALRRYANLWVPGRWIVFPPLGPVHFSASTLDKAVEMAKRDEARAALSRDAGERS